MRESMKPSFVKVDHCRVCLSVNIADLGIRKNFYLMNVDQTVSLSYAICKDCQFVFHGEYVGDDFLGDYYKLSPMLRREESTVYEIDQNQRQGDFLKRHLNIEGWSVLEIGAHTGAFLAHLHKRYGCRSYFDELSEEARRVLASQQGLTDYRDVVKDTQMDMVVLRHVLEHIFGLDGFLDYVRAILKPDGYLFIEVPDWSWLDEHTDPLIFEHLNQFSTHNLIYLMRRNGWQSEAVEKSIVEDDPATPNRVQRLLFRPTRVVGQGNEKIVEQFQQFHQDCYERGTRRLEELVETIGKGKRIALYPASHLTFTALHESSISEADIVGIFDIDPKKKGKVVAGIEVFPAANLKEVRPDMILLFTMGYEREIRESFKEMGLASEVISITQLLGKL